MHQPARIGGDQDVALFEDAGYRLDPFDVGLRVASCLELKPAVALRTVARHFPGHLFGALLRDGPVEHEVLAVAASQQRTGRLGRIEAVVVNPEALFAKGLDLDRLVEGVDLGELRTGSGFSLQRGQFSTSGRYRSASGGISVMPSATISASAEMVAVGLAPTALGSKAPSATYRP